MNTVAKLGIGCGAVAVVASVGLVLVAPALLRQAGEVVGPIQRVKRSQAALDAMVDAAGWKKPDRDALGEEQLARFFAVRARVEGARRNAGPHLDVLPRKNVRSLEELKQVPGIIRDVTGVVGAEMEAFVEAKMPPSEYHWIERLVYERWRGALKRAGVYPVAVRAAAREIETAAASEPDARVRARLESLARELRARPVRPPEGFDPATHELLLDRIDDVERHSLDDVVAPYIPVPR